MARTAILIDGGFYRKVGKYQGLITSNATESADNLYRYCQKHLEDEYDLNKRSLYRIFYYDCPPLESLVYHPYDKKPIDMKLSSTYVWTTVFYNELRKKRKMALRLGKLSNYAEYVLSVNVQKELLEGTKKIEDIHRSDFELSVDQKGVDMRIGLDIASLAFKQQVDQIILIAGDSDFVPAVKHARREGIDVILDPMGKHTTPELQEHIDGLKSHYKDYK